jgi:ElaB/YqjD/DUF883 family membrane-anchored ribosome-binding protein
MSDDMCQPENDPNNEGSSNAPCGVAAHDGLASATEALRRAKAELRKAHEFYEDVRRRAAERVESVRKTTVGDLADTALGVVKKHPAAGLLAVAAAGFLLGRWLKR